MMLMTVTNQGAAAAPHQLLKLAIVLYLLDLHSPGCAVKLPELPHDSGLVPCTYLPSGDEEQTSSSTDQLIPLSGVLRSSQRKPDEVISPGWTLDTEPVNDVLPTANPEHSLARPSLRGRSAAQRTGAQLGGSGSGPYPALDLHLKTSAHPKPHAAHHLRMHLTLQHSDEPAMDREVSGFSGTLADQEGGPANQLLTKAPSSFHRQLTHLGSAEDHNNLRHDDEYAMDESLDELDPDVVEERSTSHRGFSEQNEEVVYIQGTIDEGVQVISKAEMDTMEEEEARKVVVFHALLEGVVTHSTVDQLTQIPIEGLDLYARGSALYGEYSGSLIDCEDGSIFEEVASAIGVDPSHVELITGSLTREGYTICSWNASSASVTVNKLATTARSRRLEASLMGAGAPKTSPLGAAGRSSMAETTYPLTAQHDATSYLTWDLIPRRDLRSKVSVQEQEGYIQPVSSHLLSKEGLGGLPKAGEDQVHAHGRQLSEVFGCPGGPVGRNQFWLKIILPTHGTLPLRGYDSLAAKRKLTTLLESMDKCAGLGSDPGPLLNDFCIMLEARGPEKLMGACHCHLFSEAAAFANFTVSSCLDENMVCEQGNSNLHIKPASGSGGDNKRTAVIVGSVVGGVVLLLLVGLVGWMCARRSVRKEEKEAHLSDISIISSDNPTERAPKAPRIPKMTTKETSAFSVACSRNFSSTDYARMNSSDARFRLVARVMKKVKGGSKSPIHLPVSHSACSQTAATEVPGPLWSTLPSSSSKRPASMSFAQHLASFESGGGSFKSFSNEDSCMSIGTTGLFGSLPGRISEASLRGERLSSVYGSFASPISARTSRTSSRFSFNNSNRTSRGSRSSAHSTTSQERLTHLHSMERSKSHVPDSCIQQTVLGGGTVPQTAGLPEISEVNPASEIGLFSLGNAKRQLQELQQSESVKRGESLSRGGSLPCGDSLPRGGSFQRGGVLQVGQGLSRGGSFRGSFVAQGGRDWSPHGSYGGSSVSQGGQDRSPRGRYGGPEAAFANAQHLQELVRRGRASATISPRARRSLSFDGNMARPLHSSTMPTVGCSIQAARLPVENVSGHHSLKQLMVQSEGLPQVSSHDEGIEAEVSNLSITSLAICSPSGSGQLSSGMQATIGSNLQLLGVTPHGWVENMRIGLFPDLSRGTRHDDSPISPQGLLHGHRFNSPRRSPHKIKQDLRKGVLQAKGQELRDARGKDGGSTPRSSPSSTKVRSRIPSITDANQSMEGTPTRLPMPPMMNELGMKKGLGSHMSSGDGSGSTNTGGGLGEDGRIKQERTSMSGRTPGPTATFHEDRKAWETYDNKLYKEDQTP